MLVCLGRHTYLSVMQSVIRVQMPMGTSSWSYSGAGPPGVGSWAAHRECPVRALFSKRFVVESISWSLLKLSRLRGVRVQSAVLNCFGEISDEFFPLVSFLLGNICLFGGWVDGSFSSRCCVFRRLVSFFV